MILLNNIKKTTKMFKKENFENFIRSDNGYMYDTFTTVDIQNFAKYGQIVIDIRNVFCPKNIKNRFLDALLKVQKMGRPKSFPDNGMEAIRY